MEDFKYILNYYSHVMNPHVLITWLQQLYQLMAILASSVPSSYYSPSELIILSYHSIYQVDTSTCTLKAKESFKNTYP